MIEDRVLTRAYEMGERKFRISIRRALWATARQMGRHLTGQFHRFGYAAVSFGAPVSLKQQLASDLGEDPVHALGKVLTDKVREIVPVLPGPLVAAVIDKSDGPLSREQVVTRASELRNSLALQGAHLHLPRDDPDYEVTVGLRQLKHQGLILEQSGKFSPEPSERAVLRFYANSILQLLDSAEAA